MAVTAQEALDHAQKIEKARPAEALDIYRQVLAHVPGNFPLLVKVAALSEQNFENDRAIAAYEGALAVKPGNELAAVGLANLLGASDPARAFQVLSTITYTGTPSKIFERRFENEGIRLRIEEWQHLASAKRPLYHATDIADVPFRFSDTAAINAIAADWVAAEPRNPAALAARAKAYLCARDYEAANKCMAEMSEIAPAEPRAWMRFGVLPEPVSLDLPPVETVIPMEATEALYIACDDHYFVTFGAQLIRSVRALGKTPIHVHIMSSSDDPRIDACAMIKNGGVVKDRDGISLTRERPQQFLKATGLGPPDYYGSVRFIRFAQFLEASGANLWLMDSDALANLDPLPMMRTVTEGLAMRVRAGRLEPWHQFSACLVKGTPTSLPYFEAVADIIANNMGRLWWGLDQYALYSAYLALRPKDFALLGPEYVGIGDFGPQSTVWCIAGTARVRLIQDQPIPPGAVDLARYAEKYKTFS